jgi:hypothetical protein
MRSPFQFIVRPRDAKRYDNTRKYGDVDFIVSVSQEDHKFSNRYAEVVSVPICYDGPIKPGDTLIVHHNVFKFYYDMYGRQKSGRSFLRDDLFLLDEDQFFLYKSSDGEWKAHSRYCFVKPAKAKKSTSLDKPDDEEPLVGTIRYINDELLAFGLQPGDEVVYQPESEYEFNVDGEPLYRMFTSNIAVQL